MGFLRHWTIVAASAAVLASGPFGCGGNSSETASNDDRTREAHSNVDTNAAPTSGATAPQESRDPVIPVVAREMGALEREMALVDEKQDTWPTEVLNSTAGKVLSEIAHVVETGVTVEKLAPLVSPQFFGDPLIPPSLETIFDRDGVRILSGVLESDGHSGPEGLAAALEALAAPFDRAHLHFKFKIDRVQIISETEATTGVIYLAMGEGHEAEEPAGVIQQNARWRVRWDISGGVEHPKLLGIEVVEFDQIVADQTLFTDCTGSALADASTADMLSLGIDYLWGRTDVAMGFSLYGEYGMSLGDVNNDGLDDLYVCQPAGLPNLLLRHNPDGTLTDITYGSGVEFLNDTPNALFADLDNDGNQDLAIGFGSHVALMRGDGAGHFELGGVLESNNPMALSAADYDNDGMLDIYVARYGDNRQRGGSDSVFDSNHGFPNVMWRNEGGFEFRDVTVEVGLDENNRKFSMAASWEDYDNDGDLDLFVANDFGRDNLYRNDGGRFDDVATEAGLEDQGAGMGAAWADIDHNGFMDLYVSNMFSSAGGRVAHQQNFAPGGVEESADEAQYFARGNTLFQNNGDGTFQDISDTARVTMGRWAWGAEFIDFNNDGLDDIFVPNGYITNHTSKDL